MLCKLQQTTLKAGLKINCNKTKMMTDHVPSEEVIIENSVIEIVEKYVYLGHEMGISRHNQTAELIRRKLFEKLRDIFKAKIPIKLKSVRS